MSVSEIQRELSQLSDSDQRKLMAWMVRRFPLRRVEELIAKAEREAREETWNPTPPAAGNIPQGEDLEQALRRIESLGIHR
jgi:hypothetical protein